jgi:hypothetical protein
MIAVVVAFIPFDDLEAEAELFASDTLLLSCESLGAVGVAIFVDCCWFAS